MKQNKTSVLTLIILMTLSTFMGVFSFTAIVSAKQTIPDAEPLAIGNKISQSNYGLSGSGSLRSSSLPKTSDPVIDGDYFIVGDIAEWLTLDDYNGYYFFTNFTLRAIGNYAEIWVQNLPDRLFEEGDPRNNPAYQAPDDNGIMRYYYPEVTDAQVAYLLDQFDSNIYLKDTAAFGVPDHHNGSESLLSARGYEAPNYYYQDEGRNVILVANVRDEAYYDATYPYYIAGFFSSTLEAYFDRNVITIDTHQWYRRLGDEGRNWDSEILLNPDLTPLTYPAVDRPNLYEGTIAHEYQHLIHDDYNPTDATFMNEACSMFAEFLCDYPVDYSAIESFLWTPDNSLTEWGDQTDLNILADYGAAFLWAMYLYDHFGGDAFLSYFVTEGVPGIMGINQALAHFGYSMTFDDVFRDWRIANLIHSDNPGHGKYNYQSLDLSGIVTTVHSAKKNKVVSGSDFGETRTILDNPTNVIQLGTYGTDYVLIDNLKNFNFIFFEGDSQATFPHWVQVDGMWYSGESDLLDTLISTEVYVEESDPWLYLTTYWDIEDFWDYGFIQVSTDGGVTWTSLANEYTNDTYATGAYPGIIANMPGLTSWSVFYDTEDPYDGVIPMKFNLTAYSGQTVQIGFHYMTDWSFTYEGWYIIDAHVGSMDLMNTLKLVDWIPDVSWMVSVIEQQSYKWRGKTYTTYSVHNMFIWDATQGIDLVWVANKEDVILVISPLMAKGTADYSFKTSTLMHRWHCWC